MRVGYYGGDSRFQDGIDPALRKSGYAYDYLQKLADITGWTYKYSYGTREEALKHLAAGDVDIVAGIHKTPKTEELFIFPDKDMGLSGQPKYFAVNRYRPDLKQKLDEAQTYLAAHHPEFWVDLWKKYYRQNDLTRLLTEEEREWLENKKILRLGYLNYNMPISGTGSNGEPIGVLSDLISILSSELKIPIEAKGYEDTKSLEESLLKKEQDFIFPIVYDSWIAERKGMLLSEPLFEDKIMLLTALDDNDYVLRKIAVSHEGIDQKDYVEHFFPKAEIYPCANRQQCIEDILKGKADSLIGTSNTLLYFLRSQGDDNTRLHAISLDEDEELSFAIPRMESPLMGILNKITQQILQPYIPRSLVQRATVHRPYSLQRVIRDNAVFLSAFFILIIWGLIILGSLVFRAKNRAEDSRKKAVKALEEAEKARFYAEEASRQAQEADASKSRFLSSVSHDIRTPMNGIIGMTAIAKANQKSPEKVLDCLNKIESSSRHLLGLINQVLDMAKISSGKMTLELTPFSLASLFNNMITINRPTAAAKAQQFLVHIHHIINEKVIGDETKLQQIFTNLVSNAVKYTPVGGRIRITFSQEPSQTPKVSYYKFIVEDNGIGMSEEFTKLIFEPFTRADNVGQTSGTGLGMAISQDYAKKMGGLITVESTLGKGSKFIATFTLENQEQKEVNLAGLIGRKVLVAVKDDEEADNLVQILTSLGLVPTSINNIQEAPEILATKDFYCLFVDWNLLAASPKKFTDKIRKDIPEHFPIIVISDIESNLTLQEIQESGADQFIEKPIFRSNLTALLEKLMGTLEEESADLNDLASNRTFSGKRVLLVEDNELNAEIAMEILEMAGLIVEWAPNGKVAVEKVQKSPINYYNCVFMDVQMPVMNGNEATKAIRALDRADASTLPIIALTANVFSDEVQTMFANGMSGYLSKPLDFEQLFNTLEKFLGGGRS